MRKYLFSLAICWLALLIVPMPSAEADEIVSMNVSGGDSTGSTTYFNGGQTIQVTIEFDAPVACAKEDSYLQVLQAEVDGVPLEIPMIDAEEGFDTFKTFEYTLQTGDQNGQLTFIEFDGYCQEEGGVSGYQGYDDPNDADNIEEDMEILNGQYNIVIDTWQMHADSNAAKTLFKPGEAISFYLFFQYHELAVTTPPTIMMNTGGAATYQGIVYEHPYTETLMEFTYTVRDGDDVSDLDIASITGGNVTDNSGNSVDFRFHEGRRLADNASLYADGTPPVVTADPAVNNTNKQGHQITLSATDRPDHGADEYTLYYLWNTSSSTPSAGSVTGVGAHVGQEAPQPDGQPTGSYYLHIRGSDDLGNEDVTTFGPYAFDNTPPTVTFSPNSGTFAEPITVDMSAADSMAGVKSIAYQWKDTAGDPIEETGALAEATLPLNQGEHVLVATVEDNAGNVETYESGVLLLDQTAPTASFSYTAPTDGEGEPVPVQSDEVTVQLAGRSGETVDAYMQWTDDVQTPAREDSNWVKFVDGKSLPHNTQVTTPEATGTWYLHVKTADDVRNVERFTMQDGVWLDNTEPVVALTLDGTNGSFRKEASTQLLVDGGTSTLDTHTIRYLISDQPTPEGDPTSWASSEDGAFELSGVSGVRYIHLYVTDRAGNAAVFTSQSFHLDHLPPTGSVAWQQPHTNETAAQAIVAATDDASSVEYTHTLEEGVWEDDNWISLSVPNIPVTLADIEGEQHIYVKFRDEAGNMSEPAQATVIYDTTPPIETGVAYSPASWTSDTVTATVYYTDHYSPDSYVQETFDENGVFTVLFQDLAGNTDSAEVTIDKIERIKPEVQFSVNGSDHSSQTATTTVTVTDNISDPDNIELFSTWSLDSENVPDSWTAIASGDPVTMDEGDGEYVLWVKAMDEAGNTAAVHSQPFLLDNTLPSGSFTYDISNRTAMPVTARLQVSESVEVTKPIDGSRTHTFLENGSFLFEFVDEAGNVGTATATVDWIDDSLPTAQVTATPDDWTNAPVDVRVSVQGEPPRALSNFETPADAELVYVITEEYGETAEPVAGATVTEAVYRFSTNGSLRFTITDLETDIQAQSEVQIDQIDHVAPTGTLRYNYSNWTQEDVTVTLEASDDRSEVTVIGSDQYIFTENGSHTFRFRDEAGNEEALTATVDWIDREPPEADIRYSTESLTNQSVTASVYMTNERGPVTILNNDGLDEVVFDDNGSFTFRFEDAAGNRGQATANVTWIDKEAPTGSLTYSTLGWTRENVTVTLDMSDNSGVAPTLTSVGGNEHVFTDNGEFTFTFVDAAGNESAITAVVDRIDKTPPQATISYSSTGATNAAVRASLVPNEAVTVLNNGGSAFYDFEANGSITFQLRDRAGNTSAVTATVDHIDQQAPIPTITYDITERTNADVIATVSADEPFYVLNNYQKPQYVFRENGSFSFIVQDLAGNTAEIEAAVDYIDKSKATTTLNYSDTEPTRDDVTVHVDADRPLTYLNNNGESTVTFTRNGFTYLQAQDELGNDYLILIEVTNIDREAPQLAYLQGENLPIPLGSPVNPIGDVVVTDNLDGVLTDETTVSHDIDPNTIGEYSVQYTVTDTAGNTMRVDRAAQVFTTDELTVYINSESTPNGEALVRGNDLIVEYFGEQGETVVKWARGKLDKGAFKTSGQLLAESEISFDKQDYYTFLVQDQERNYRLVHVYVIPSY